MSEMVAKPETLWARIGDLQRRHLSMRRIRLASGLALFAYVLSHLLNHAVGLVSLQAMEGVRVGFMAVWGSWPGLVLLYGALIAHVALAFAGLYRKRSLRMARWEAMQYLFGLAVPPLLFEHIIGTRIAHALYGTAESYGYVLNVLWVLAPMAGYRQIAVLVIAWVHGCIGLHFWLRIRPWYPRAEAYLFGGAILVPVLSILGFVAGGRELARLMADPAWAHAARAAMGIPDAAGIATLYSIRGDGLIFYGALIAAVVLARLVRDRLARRRAVLIQYSDGKRVEVPRGTTILEASRIAGIPHASVCGGRGRCSTCRVRIDRGAEFLPPPGPDEARVLARVGAGPDTRLACQVRPRRAVAVTPLLPPAATPESAQARPGYLQGVEEEIAILFCDLRGFTQFAERRLPYDTVFLLNRFFRAMGEAVEEAGGRVDKFIGDGVMALFGVESDTGAGCRQAIDAARRMALHLDEINTTLAHDLAEPLRIGIGIHVGHVIVGEMGHAPAVSVTAIGDAVNAASRLETLTKEYDCQLVVSQDTVDAAGLDLSGFASLDVPIRGRDQMMAVRLIPDAAGLPDLSVPDVPEPRRLRRKG